MLAKLKEQGPDWLTATSQSEQSAALMSDIWEMIKQNEALSRKDVREDSWYGYVGERAPHMFFGTRKEQALMLLSGLAARMYANDVIEVGGRPSRLDLQATFEVENVSAEVLTLYERSRHFEPLKGRPPAVTVLRGRSGEYETLYVGRRSSETFIRVYDKEKESRSAYYRSCIRLEAEYKSHTARQVAGAWQNAAWDTATLMGLLKASLMVRGVAWEGFDRFDASQPLVLRKTTSTEAKMAWLMQQVSPTVQALMEEVGETRLISVLFPDGLDKHQSDDTLDAAALERGC